MDLRFCNFRGTQYPVKYVIQGMVNSSETNLSLFTRYSIFQIGFSTFVLINAFGPRDPEIQPSSDGNVRVWELTNVNRLTDLNFQLEQNGVNLHERMIYRASVTIDRYGFLTVKVHVSTERDSRQLFDQIVWVSADETNPGLMDNSVPQPQPRSGLFGN